MGGQDQATARVDDVFQSGQRHPDAGVVGNPTILEWNVEIHTDEGAFSLERYVADRLLIHKFYLLALA
jgi:hypothetical protein